LKLDSSLHARVLKLAAGATIRLEVDGVVGEWKKMKDGADGRPTPGIKPVGAMAKVWARLQERRGQNVRVRSPQVEDDLLRLADQAFDEWHSAEDEEAFGGLRPL
jgi:hypothetical protein